MWEKRVEVLRFEPRLRAIQAILTLLFCIWGVGGFALFSFEASSLIAIARVALREPQSMVSGVGMVAFMAVIVPQSLIWIGGILFFGIAALLGSFGYRATKSE
jgi:hypothetical protein